MASYTTNCVPQQRALTRCSEENVANLRMVKEKCSVQVEAFKSCTAGKKAEDCVDELEALYECHKKFS